MIESWVSITQPTNFALPRRTLRHGSGVDIDLAGVSEQSIYDVKIVTFEAMRSQSRPSVDS